MNCVLEMKNIKKEFLGVRALDGINLSLNEGEILAVVGENGAGKSTLMKILSGVYSRSEYSGEIILDGKPVVFKNPRDASDKGIQMIYQEVSLMMDMTVAENIGIHHMPVRKHARACVDYKKLEERAKELLAIVGLDVEPSRRVRGLSTSQQQMISICKAIDADPKILVLDEPTSSFTPQEAERLFAVLRKLKTQGVSSIYISHKLDEVISIADRVLAMRDGQVTGILENKNDFNHDRIIEMIVGRSITNLFPSKGETRIGEEVLRVENLSVPHRFIKGKNIIEDASFQLNKGEILGIAGLVGSGRSELVNAIIGMLPKSQETKVYVNGSPATIRNPREAKKYKIALISEDRKVNGFIGSMSVCENITLAHLESLFPYTIIHRKKENGAAEEMKNRLSIKASSVETKVRTLSGGNQQKVVVGKWLMEEPEILIMDEPTRGIDVGAKYEIYSIMRQLTSQGVSILMISSELVEILGMSDRVMVVGNGRIRAIVDNDGLTEEQIMRIATVEPAKK